MPTSPEIVAELRSLGYDGPVSYAKPQLMTILAQHQHAAPAEVAEQHGEASTPPVADIDNGRWCGLETGQLVAIDGAQSGWTYRFVEYVDAKRITTVKVGDPTPQESKPYVVVKAQRRKQLRMRYIAPERILDNKTKKPVMS